jgi:hypothetical protein
VLEALAGQAGLLQDHAGVADEIAELSCGQDADALVKARRR